MYRLTSKTSMQQSNSMSNSTEMQFAALDVLLENETNQNKIDSWNKLNKTTKLQKLHAFAEKFIKDNHLPIKETKSLKLFFNECLEKNKLQKTKSVVYDKETGLIVSIPALSYSPLKKPSINGDETTTHNFTLKNMDAKRISTIKSLTPHRISNKEKDTEPENDISKSI